MIVPIPEDRVAWLRVRQELQQQGHVSASEAGALCGMHDYTTLGDLAVKYLAPTEIVDDVQTPAQARGHLLERPCLDWLEAELGVTILPPSVMYADNGFAMTPDGEMVGSDTDMPEAKTYKGYLDGEVLPQWRCQAIAQCLARPTLQRIHFTVLDSSLRFQHFVVEPTDAEKENLAERARRFLAFVSLGMIPAEVELSEVNVRALWPRPEPELAKEATAEDAEIATEWAIARQRRLDAEKAEAAAKNRLANALRENAVLTVDGAPIVTFRTRGSGRVLAPAGDLR